MPTTITTILTTAPIAPNVVVDETLRLNGPYLPIYAYPPTQRAT